MKSNCLKINGTAAKPDKLKTTLLPADLAQSYDGGKLQRLQSSSAGTDCGMNAAAKFSRLSWRGENFAARGDVQVLLIQINGRT